MGGVVERLVGIAVLFLCVMVSAAVLRSAGPGGGAARADGKDRPEGQAYEALDRARRWRAEQVLGDYLPPRAESRPISLKRTGGIPATVSEARLLLLTSGVAPSRTGAPGRLAARRSDPSALQIDEPIRLADMLELDPDPVGLAAGIELVKRADGLATRGDAAAAIATYDTASRHLPHLADWLNVRAAEVAAGRGDTTETERRLGVLDPWFALEWGWPLRVRARRQAGDLRGAAAAAVAAANSLDEPSSRSAAWAVAGDTRRLRGDDAGARAAYRRAIEVSPASPGALTAARMLATVPDATPRDRLVAGRVYLRHGNVERGIAGLKSFLAAGVGTEIERAEAQLELGRALARAGKFAEAEPVLRVLADSAPTSRLRADALFEIGRSQYRQGRETEGRATYLALATLYPGEPAAGEAMFLVADLDHDRGDIDSARRYYTTAASIQPRSERAASALMRLGGLAFAAGDYTTAARVFDRYRDHHPDGSAFQQASYWSGRAHMALGDSALGLERMKEARLADPFSYYGLRAAERLGQDFWDSPIDVSPPHNPRLERAIQRALARVDLLRELGWRAAAEFELVRIRRHYHGIDGALYALAEAFNHRGQIFDGVRLGWEIYSQEEVWNPRLLRIIYPFPFRELITAEARQRGLDPYLVAGLIRQESMFQPAIRSHAGAVGLMQIMPATGRSLARSAGISAFDANMLQQPEVNVRLGIMYLEELLRAYGNRPLAALAAYNAGPGRVGRWRQFPEWADEDLFAERIPFNETREYVKIVRRNARVYAALYPLPDAEPAVGD